VQQGTPIVGPVTNTVHQEIEVVLEQHPTELPFLLRRESLKAIERRRTESCSRQYERRSALHIIRVRLSGSLFRKRCAPPPTPSSHHVIQLSLALFHLS